MTLELPKFVKLNDGWNAEPNAPVPSTRVAGRDVILEFVLNHMQFPAFAEEEKGVLRFCSVSKYRLGPTNDEGWYRGQCRYSRFAPAWGEFYEVSGSDPVANQPVDWKHLSRATSNTKHFLFYFRDETFEAMAADWGFEPVPESALMKLSVG